MKNSKDQIYTVESYSLAEFEDPTLPSEQIQLLNTWCFWHDKYNGPGQTAQEFQGSQSLVFTFNTVQKFWLCFNSLPCTIQLPFKSSYHLMKKGIRPVWEDPSNEDGGFWVLRYNKQVAKLVWRELCVALIGEHFHKLLKDGHDDINGLTISIRKEDTVIQVWNKSASHESEQQIILNFIRSTILADYPMSHFFYKACRQHDSYDTHLNQKLVSSKCKS